MTEERFKPFLAVNVIFLLDNKVFLMRRANTGFNDGNYSLPNGHGEQDEQLTLAAIREAKEETGIEIDPNDLEFALLMHRINETDRRNYIDVYFVVRRWVGEPQINEPDKCDAADWFNINQLPENTIPYIKEAIMLSVEGRQNFIEHGW